MSARGVWQWAGGAAILAAACCWVSQGLAGARTEPDEAGQASLAGWLVYWLPDPSTEAAARHAGAMQELAVFAWHFDEQGRIVPATPWVTETLTALMAKPRGERPRILATIVNDVARPDGTKRLKDAERVHREIATPEALAKHVEQLMAIAAQADGLELDYENLRAADRQAFSRLVETLAARLHAERKVLSVVVQAKLNDKVRDGAGAMDWRAIAAHADSLKLMAYYYRHSRGRPGPPAPPDWVVKLLRFMETQVPPEKIVVVLTCFGFDWPDGRPGKAIGPADALKTAQKYGATVVRDPATGTPHFTYGAAGVRHEVWFEDAESLKQKITALRRAGARHLGWWHIGAGAEVIEAATEAALR